MVVIVNLGIWSNVVLECYSLRNFKKVAQKKFAGVQCSVGTGFWGVSPGGVKMCGLCVCVCCEWFCEGECEGEPVGVPAPRERGELREALETIVSARSVCLEQGATP